MKEIATLIFVIIVFAGCGDKNVTEADDYLTDEDYAKEMEIWLDSVIVDRINKKPIEELFEDIRGNHIQGMFTGIDGRLSDSYISYMALEEVLIDSQILDSLNSQNPGIRYHSFLLATQRNRSDVFGILKNILDDTTIVTSQFGCIFDSTTVADLCIDLVTEKYYHSYEGYEPSNYQLTIQEKEELDSLIINSKTDLNYKETLEYIMLSKSDK